MATTDHFERGREELLTLLASMGVKLPATTRLPLSELNVRLARALDCAQRHTELAGKKGAFKLEKMAPWGNGKPLSEAMYSMSLEELATGVFDNNAFGELRRVVSGSIAAVYGAQVDNKFFFEDPAMDRSIKLSVCGAFAVTDNAPLIAVEFTRGVVADDDEEGVKIINTPEAHTLLVKLLELNASHTQVPQSEKGTTNRATLSYILPLGPLSMKEIGSLTKDVGCAVCGEKMKSVCSGCHSVSYCSKDCQRADWKRHKPACHSLETGTWLDISYAKGFTSIISNSARSLNSPSRASGSGPNVHGSNAFLVKVQISGYNGSTMLVYDRQRSFDGQIMRTDDPVSFQRLANIVHTGYMGLKVYLWAKYAGPRRLSICLDRKPDQAGILW
ncbi:hypothetical protein M0805_009579 [Coniferiporia weirii]|nr:hypothetical protein M0805_009579 [Coniferiporia weirii]